MPYNREWYQAHVVEHVARQRKYLDNGGREVHNAWCRTKRQQQRQRAIEYLGGQCLDCGIEDERVFQFDHVPNRGEKLRNVLNSTTWEACRTELDKCDLVCANCHCIRTRERQEKAYVDPRTAATAAPALGAPAAPATAAP